MENCTDSNTPYFSFNGHSCVSRIVDITDGDTVKAIINFKDVFYKIIIRLNGIDTCETRSKNDDNKNMGIKAKLRLYNLITGKVLDTNDKKLIKNELNTNFHTIYLKCYDFDKYGRILADIYSEESETTSLSDILIIEKLAYKYEGKTKLSEEDQLNLLNK